MLIQEMHVQIEQRLQRFSSAFFDIFYPEEKDILINTAQERMIRSLLPDDMPKSRQETYQRYIKQYKDLQTFVTKVKLPMYYLEEDVQYSVLPYNIYDYISSSSSSYYNCTGLDLTNRTNTNLYIAYLTFEDDAATDNLYADFNWVISRTDNSTVVLADKSNTNLPNLKANDEKFLISNFAIYQTNQSQDEVKVYWERYGEIYKSNTFIFVSSSSNLTDITMNVSNGVSYTATFNPLVLETYEGLEAKVVKKANRLIENEFVAAFNDNPMQRTDYDSPIVELSTNRILLHHNSNFVTNQIELVYIRKPIPVNIFLNVSSELHESRHHKLLDIAAEIAAGYINDPRQVKALSFINSSNE